MGIQFPLKQTLAFRWWNTFAIVEDCVVGTVTSFGARNRARWISCLTFVGTDLGARWTTGNIGQAVFTLHSCGMKKDSEC